MKTMTRGRFWSVFLALVLVRGMAVAQVAGPDTIRVVYPDDTVAVRLHSADPADPTLQSLWEADVAPTLSKAQTKGKEKRQRRDWSQWRPEAKRAMWLALVLPGAGQVYNRKYWKLPIIYGGFAGCIYAMTWNNQMYHDYSQAYLDIMDDDPTTESYKKLPAPRHGNQREQPGPLPGDLPQAQEPLPQMARPERLCHDSRLCALRHRRLRRCVALGV